MEDEEDELLKIFNRGKELQKILEKSQTTLEKFQDKIETTSQNIKRAEEELTQLSLQLDAIEIEPKSKMRQLKREIASCLFGSGSSSQVFRDK